VLFSAHWESQVEMVSHAENYSTIYDFYGFPEELYHIQYPAKGDPSLAKSVHDLLQDHGIESQADFERGLDHGAWVILKHLYPEADIPVISMSVNSRLTPEEQYRIGKALAPLPEEDILIIGSGGTVHNLRAVDFTKRSSEVDRWALEFDQWLENEILSWNLEALFSYREAAPYADLAVPLYGTEHFVPIFYAMGAADLTKQAQLLYRSYIYGNLSYSVWQFD